MTASHLEPREWKLRARPAGEIEAAVEALKSETGLSRLALRVCLLRGLGSAQAIREHLAPRLDSLSNPFSIRDMDRAVDRLARARAGGELVGIFGDYDVDGTTGAALLSWGFREMGLRYQARQPDRFKDGYGLNVRAVEEAKQAGVTVLVTVDCGISSFDAASKARELGIDLIVVDHHQIDPKRGLPEALAVLDPQRADCESGLKQLCGCGLAFYLLMALRSRGRQESWFQAGQEPNLRQHLDLVVMATAADMVPLTGDNHILVRHGLEVLKSTKKAGVRALLEVAGLTQKELSPGHLGFVIGPRINASGRMQSASLALELLTTTDSFRAYQLARELEKLNDERAELQNQIWDQVRARVEDGISRGLYKHGIVVADAAWHEGVVGIVATRVTEMFRRPAAVIALREDHGKGSVRSYAGKDVLGALRESAEHLLGFGGHKHAAGLSVALDRVDALAAAFDDALSRAEEDREARPLLIEGEAMLEEFDTRSLEEIERLGPFGPGNPEPVFLVRAQMRGHRVLKGRHLKMELGLDGRPVEAIFFGGAEREDLVGQDGEPVEWLSAVPSYWAAVPELNRFRGQVKPTLRVRDWRREAPQAPVSGQTPAP
ncbi:MAG TPA: single-stranded-DNA-specific exonuclease RecJ [Bdellovibrionota bacterium]|nr:single-stranded-DNA-specific exonuclease RecJ [Bdellovibrionota bacterium]